MRNVFTKLATAMAFALMLTTNVQAAPKSNQPQNNANNLSNKILFVEKEKAGSTYLSIVDPNGSNKKRLTPAFNNIIFPKYNDKSGWIAFTNQTDKMESEIYLLNKTGDKIMKVLTKAAFEDFSPDGKRFLYTTTDEKAELYVYTIAAKTAVKISQNLKVTAASWSQDGDWIITSVMAEDGTLDLYMISCYAQGIFRMTNTPGVNEAFPSFSNDNLKAVYYTNRHGENELEIMGVGTHENLALSRPMITGTHPSFSPDDKYVVYQQGDNIMVSDIGGLKSKKIATGKTPRWTK